MRLLVLLSLLFGLAFAAITDDCTQGFHVEHLDDAHPSMVCRLALTPGDDIYINFHVDDAENHSFNAVVSSSEDWSDPIFKSFNPKTVVHISLDEENPRYPTGPYIYMNVTKVSGTAIVDALTVTGTFLDDMRPHPITNLAKGDRRHFIFRSCNPNEDLTVFFNGPTEGDKLVGAHSWMNGHPDIANHNDFNMTSNLTIIPGRDEFYFPALLFLTVEAQAAIGGPSDGFSIEVETTDVVPFTLDAVHKMNVSVYSGCYSYASFKVPADIDAANLTIFTFDDSDKNMVNIFASTVNNPPTADDPTDSTHFTPGHALVYPDPLIKDDTLYLAFRADVGAVWDCDPKDTECIDTTRIEFEVVLSEHVDSIIVGDYNSRMYKSKQEWHYAFDTSQVHVPQYAVGNGHWQRANFIVAAEAVFFDTDGNVPAGDAARGANISMSMASYDCSGDDTVVGTPILDDVDHRHGSKAVFMEPLHTLQKDEHLSEYFVEVVNQENVDAFVKTSVGVVFEIKPLSIPDSAIEQFEIHPFNKAYANMMFVLNETENVPTFGSLRLMAAPKWMQSSEVDIFVSQDHPLPTEEYHTWSSVAKGPDTLSIPLLDLNMNKPIYVAVRCSEEDTVVVSGLFLTGHETEIEDCGYLHSHVGTQHGAKIVSRGFFQPHHEADGTRRTHSMCTIVTDRDAHCASPADKLVLSMGNNEDATIYRTEFLCSDPFASLVIATPDSPSAVHFVVNGSKLTDGSNVGYNIRCASFDQVRLVRQEFNIEADMSVEPNMPAGQGGDDTTFPIFFDAPIGPDTDYEITLTTEDLLPSESSVTAGVIPKLSLVVCSNEVPAFADPNEVPGNCQTTSISHDRPSAVLLLNSQHSSVSDSGFFYAGVFASGFAGTSVHSLTDVKIGIEQAEFFPQGHKQAVTFTANDPEYFTTKIAADDPDMSETIEIVLTHPAGALIPSTTSVDVCLSTEEMHPVISPSSHECVAFGTLKFNDTSSSKIDLELPVSSQHQMFGAIVYIALKMNSPESFMAFDLEFDLIETIDRDIDATVGLMGPQDRMVYRIDYRKIMGSHGAVVASIPTVHDQDLFYTDSYRIYASIGSEPASLQDADVVAGSFHGSQVLHFTPQETHEHEIFVVIETTDEVMPHEEWWYNVVIRSDTQDISFLDSYGDFDERRATHKDQRHSFAIDLGPFVDHVDVRIDPCVGSVKGLVSPSIYEVMAEDESKDDVYHIGTTNDMPIHYWFHSDHRHAFHADSTVFMTVAQAGKPETQIDEFSYEIYVDADDKMPFPEDSGAVRVKTSGSNVFITASVAEAERQPLDPLEYAVYAISRKGLENGGTAHTACGLKARGVLVSDFKHVDKDAEAVTFLLHTSELKRKLGTDRDITFNVVAKAIQRIGAEDHEFFHAYVPTYIARTSSTVMSLVAGGLAGVILVGLIIAGVYLVATQWKTARGARKGYQQLADEDDAVDVAETA